MATLTGSSSPNRGLQVCQCLRNHLRTMASAGVLRAVLIAAVVAGVMTPAHTRSASQSGPVQATANCPLLGAKVDLAFIIDRSGSLDEKSQGQTYNIEIEGVRRALLDPGVIPRDGSIAVAVFTFAGAPALRQAFTEIRSAADAAAVAATVEALKCGPDGTCPQKGPNPESNVGPALLMADDHIDKNKRAGARRVLVVSSDGGFTDTPFAEQASSHLETSGRVSEIDVILMGAEVDRANADRIVFPKPTDVLPGATLVIDPDDCNRPGAASGCADLSASQVKQFAEDVRRVLRSQVVPSSLTVNTEADPDPNTPITGGTLSLRQAIEFANCNNGATAITFANNVQTISPRVALPPLTAPEITICGCEAKNCDPATDDKQKCKRLVTIDGIKVVKTMDSEGKPLDDGILIRSNRDVVRGLRLINFVRAGVAIDSRVSSDNVGFNRVERNLFEKNIQAGVCVLDPSTNPANAVVHNVGNTISMNDFLSTGTPIDLVCDGPTPNDLGDPDQGPNTLLNFPDKLDVGVPAAVNLTAAATGISLSGQLIGPTVAGAVVEIFSITSFKAAPGGRVIDAVTFLARTTADASGRFSITGLSDSPTCGYTATATDLDGNTSELMFPCSGFGKAKVTNLDFTEVAVPNGNKQHGTITIENIGCGPLTIRSYSVRRDKLGDVSFPKEPPEPSEKDLAHFSDLAHFFIEDTVVKRRKSNVKLVPPITLDVGQTRSFTVVFDPAIPAVAGTKNPDAAFVLPDAIKSTLVIADDGCSASERAVGLTALVNRAIKLINPNDPRSAPLVTLVRSGDIFTVTFSIFDSNFLNVDRALYQFFDQSGGSISLDQPDPNLGAVVAGAGLVQGQSFTVKQTFSNAKQNRKVAKVLVTVFGKDGSKDSAFGSMSSSSAGVSAQSVLNARSAVLVLPDVKLSPVTKGTRKAP